LALRTFDYPSWRILLSALPRIISRWHDITKPLPDDDDDDPYSFP